MIFFVNMTLTEAQGFAMIFIGGIGITIFAGALFGWYGKMLEEKEKNDSNPTFVSKCKKLMIVFLIGAFVMADLILKGFNTLFV